MTAIGETARIGLPKKLPTGLESYPHATLAWQVHARLLAQAPSAAGFTPEALNGKPGWRWKGTLSAAVSRTPGAGTTDDTVIKVGRFLCDTGNLVLRNAAGHPPEYWIRAEWQDASPATLAARQREREAAEDKAQQRRLRLAPPEPEAPDGDQDVDLGVIAPDQHSLECRWCAHVGRNIQDQAQLTALRRHEREHHPNEYWPVTTHVCVTGSGDTRCEWPAGNVVLYGKHLEAVHRMGSVLSRDAIAPQAKALADRLRAQPSQPVPPVTQIRPAPPPPSSGDVAALRAQLADAVARATAAEERLAAVQAAAWNLLSIAHGETAEKDLPQSATG